MRVYGWASFGVLRGAHVIDIDTAPAAQASLSYLSGKNLLLFVYQHTRSGQGGVYELIIVVLEEEIIWCVLSCLQAMAVLIETSQGDIVIDLYTEERPKSSFNFLKLCKVKYYNFCLVHTVQRHTIIQTGDPTGEGEGGECIWGVIKGEDYRFFEAETTPRLKHEKVGLVSMVNNGHDHHGSQFVITTGENLDYLDGKHTVFGEVAEGCDVLMKINEAYCDKEGRPYQDIRIYHTVVLEDPYDDPEGMCIFMLCMLHQQQW